MSLYKAHVYPDVADVHARKAERRVKLSRLSMGEKIALVEALRERLAPFKAVRNRRNRVGSATKSA